MGYQITKQFSFSASHWIGGLPEGHQCARLHGHNYRVEIVIRGHELDDHGFILDYGELDVIGEWIKQELDHRHLNDVMGTDRTTAENLARMIYDKWSGDFPEIYAVRVSETDKTWASYDPFDRGL